MKYIFPTKELKQKARKLALKHVYEKTNMSFLGKIMFKTKATTLTLDKEPFLYADYKTKTVSLQMKFRYWHPMTWVMIVIACIMLKKGSYKLHEFIEILADLADPSYMDVEIPEGGLTFNVCELKEVKK